MDEIDHTQLLATKVIREARDFVGRLASGHELQTLPNLCQVVVESSERVTIPTVFGEKIVGRNVHRTQSAIALTTDKTLCLLLTGDFVVKMYEYNSRTGLSIDTETYRVFDIRGFTFNELRLIDEFLTNHGVGD